MTGIECANFLDVMAPAMGSFSLQKSCLFAAVSIRPLEQSARIYAWRKGGR